MRRSLNNIYLFKVKKIINETSLALHLKLRDYFERMVYLQLCLLIMFNRNSGLYTPIPAFPLPPSRSVHDDGSISS